MAAIAAAAHRTARGPQWWRSGVRTPVWWAAAVIALAWNYGFMYWELHVGFMPVGVLVWATLGWTAEIVVGLLFWMWRPRNIVGPLLVSWAALAHVLGLPELLPDSRFAVTVGFLFAWVFLAAYVWMLFAFPNGVIWNRWARGVLLFFAVWQSLIYLPNLLFQRTGIPIFYSSSEASSDPPWVRWRLV